MNHCTRPDSIAFVHAPSTAMTPSKQPEHIGFASIEALERAQRELDLALAQESPIDLAAADWHDRSLAGLTEQEAQELALWQAQSPAHAAAYEDMEHSYQLLHNLSQEAALQPDTAAQHSAAWQELAAAPMPEPAAAPNYVQPKQRPARSWLDWAVPGRRTLAGGLCSLAIGVMGWQAWQYWQAPIFQASYQTAQGQRQEVTLTDGSQLTLDTSTRLAVTLYRNRREVQLQDGQVLLNVAPDANRPLEVQAGPATVRVLGTRFSVRHLAEGDGAGAVDVQVEEGRVSVQSQQRTASSSTTTAPAATQTLTARQGLQVSPEGVMAQVAQLPAGDIAPWRSGLIRFSNTPLGSALVELERYGPTKLAITDPKVAALPIGGVYEAGRPDRFAQLLVSLHPLKLVLRDDGQMEIQLRR